MKSTGGVAKRFAPLAARLERRLSGDLPFAVRFWDGSELKPDGGDGSRDTLVVRDSRALAYIATAPNQLGLGRAWVAGDLDLDGDLERALRAGERFRGLRIGLGDRAASLGAALRAGALRLRGPAPPASEARIDGRLHSLRRDRAAGRHHYDVSNDFYRLVLGLRFWIANLAANREAAIVAAGAERERIWRLYMTGSALAFERGDISVQQLLATVPGAPAEVPLARCSFTG